MEEIASTNVELDKLRASTSQQGLLVRQLKKDGADQAAIQEAVAKLKELKVQVNAMEEKKVNTDWLDGCLIRRMIVVPSFEIHGGEKGLFDLGPVGCALKENILSLWKNHFVLKEGMLQVEATCLTSEKVLKASGHVDRFTDMMCKDLTTGACYRADKLIENHIENLLEKTEVSPAERADLERIHRLADSYSPSELDELIQNKLKITSPETGKELGKCFPFNLMFATTIGPEGTTRGFLRPETAQGIFVNFKRLLEFNNGKLPFAAAQIGLGFRNEISPRAGLLRVREFCMAEIEHFCEEDKMEHPRIEQVHDVKLTLFPSSNQLGSGTMLSGTVKDALESGVIKNETLAYFMARTQQFLLKIGIDKTKLRFRQHLPTEMAHYARDCWDAEIKLAVGWVECVGHADRSCYDLKVHSEVTGVELVASRRVDPPIKKTVLKAKVTKQLVGKKFKKESAIVVNYFETTTEENKLQLETKLQSDGKADVDIDGKTFEIVREMVSFKSVEEVIHQETFYPHVIEPSFGIGRILYAVLEHSFKLRDENSKVEKGSVQKTLFSFKPQIAPTKCAVFPLQKKSEYLAYASKIQDKLLAGNIQTVSDQSSTNIGKRYARVDEVGVLFCVTVDDVAINGGGLTIRERDTMEQVRVPESELLSTLNCLISEDIQWSELVAKLGLVTVEE